MESLPEVAPAVHCDPIGPTVADALEAAELLNQGEPGDADPPFDGTVTFADWLTGEAAHYRSKGTAAAEYLASLIEDRAQWARYLGAATPADLLERLDLIEGWRDERLAAKGGVL